MKYEEDCSMWNDAFNPEISRENFDLIFDAARCGRNIGGVVGFATVLPSLLGLMLLPSTGMKRVCVLGFIFGVIILFVLSNDLYFRFKKQEKIRLGLLKRIDNV